MEHVQGVKKTGEMVLMGQTGEVARLELFTGHVHSPDISHDNHFQGSPEQCSRLGQLLAILSPDEG